MPQRSRMHAKQAAQAARRRHFQSWTFKAVLYAITAQKLALRGPPQWFLVLAPHACTPPLGSDVAATGHRLGLGTSAPKLHEAIMPQIPAPGKAQQQAGHL